MPSPWSHRYCEGDTHMPRILILHASLGSGHVTAANALRDAFTLRGITGVTVADVFDFGNALYREAVTKTYGRLSENAPLLWKRVYESSDQKSVEQAVSANRLRVTFQRPFVRSLVKLVKEVQPDVIIGTHFIPVEILTAERDAGAFTCPIYCVITDYMSHSNWVSPGVDGYFVAADITRDALFVFGLDPHIVHVTGIPIDPAIGLPKSKAEMRAKYNLPAECPVTALLGGALNPEQVRRNVERILGGESDGALVVIAGRNEALEPALEGLSSGPHVSLHTYGMVQPLDDLITASDLVITKAGGLIVSEVLARGRPMVIVEPIPGQEEWNADYVSLMGAGVQLRISAMLPPTIATLLSDPARLAGMQQAATAAGRPRAALDIVDSVLAALRRPI